MLNNTLKEKVTTAPAGPQNPSPSREKRTLFLKVMNELVQVNIRLNAIHALNLAHMGITASHRTILRELLENGSRTVAHMAAGRQVSRQYVQSVVNQLFAKGCVEFVDNPYHKRSPLVRATAKGEDAFRTILRAERPWAERALGDYELDDLNQVLDFLQTVGVRLDAICVEAKSASAVVGSSKRAD